jgi:hypothetical protein
MAAKKRNASAELLARGGGNATAGGINFQASVGAIFASQLLTERKLDDRLRLGDARIRSIRFETEAPLDDILIETNTSGWIFVQVKTALSLSENPESEFGKTVAQIARQWSACSDGTGERGWDRSFASGRDRMIIAVGPDASGAITKDLATALASLQAPSAAPLPQAQLQAIEKLSALYAAAWQKIVGVAPSTEETRSALRFVTILPFNPDGPDRLAAIEALGHVTEDANGAPGVFAAIARECESLMAARRGTDAADLRRVLAGSGFQLLSTPSYQDDVRRLREYSQRTQSHLSQYEETKVGGVSVKINRECTAAVVVAAQEESLVLVGEPGAGKSAVVSAAAKQLRAEGRDVIELAVDRLPVESLDGLRIELGLQHALRDALDNWPGSDTAFLFIDALDATRGGRSESVFRALIAEAVNLAGGRWRVVASIRTFDLRLGEQFRTLFEGSPPFAQYADPAFPTVCHIHVPRWTDRELADFLEKAPAIGTAIERGGPRLHDLALVPFNTRLLADLISGGLAADAFGEVGSQVELLALYWEHRVEEHGPGAELCLRNAVRQMVTSRSLQAPRLDVAEPDPAAFENLLRSNVLVAVSGNRYVSFRHHILFDYAASRVFIDPTNIAATGDLLRRDRGLGLMLAPALSFALQDLWVTGQNGRPQFWLAVVHFAGDSASDPIARSVAARAACELPTDPEDMRGLVELFSASTERQQLAFRAFSHVVGALTVRIEDRQSIQITPWCHVAAEASVHVAELAWPLRTLLYMLVERFDLPEQYALLGLAARRLLNYALGQPASSSILSAAALGFVADTYASDPASSRGALERLLRPERLRDHAHEDMPWLARKVLKIGAFDPAFAIEIYRTVFSHGVDDDGATSIGESRILPLRSNRRQDYEMAKFSLKEAFPRFLEAHPFEGVRALIAALEGYVATKHPLRDGVREISVRGGPRDAKLIEDQSHIYAWNPDDAHSDNALSLVKAFTSRLNDAPEAETLLMATEVIERNRLAILWSRLFMVAARRSGMLAAMLWPYAVQRAFLVSTDTSKDAIDLIAARYKDEAWTARESFERDIMGLEFPRATDPAGAKRRFLLRVFGAIGAEHLMTPEAQEVLKTAPEGSPALSNPRAFQITTMEGGSDRYWWLKEDGVDLSASPNAQLLALVEATDELLGQPGQDGTLGDDLARGVAQLAALWRAAQEAEGVGAAAKVVEYAEDIAARGCTKLSHKTDELRVQPEVLSKLCDQIDLLLGHPSPKITEDAESADESRLIAVRGVRVDGVEATMNLCRINTATVERFKAKLFSLARDPHPAVRLAIASRLAMLWNTARDVMWGLADICGKLEHNLRVLRFFADFLMRVVHADPARVEALVSAILPRARGDQDKASVELIEAIGSVVVILWVTHERQAAKTILDDWLAEPAAHEPELGHAIQSIRDGLVVGYTAQDGKDAPIRVRCQEFAASVIEVTATGLERYFDLTEAARTAEETQSATMLAKLLDEMSDQYYFASGAFQEGRGEEPSLPTVEIKRKYLDGNDATFHRIGDVGTPHTIYHLIEMLEYLVPADPARVFDLVSHALLTAGRKQGYQFESLGADRFVAVIGRLLADHRELFVDDARRDQLVACLEAFVEAGWPAARRLLYRLPELLQ